MDTDKLLYAKKYTIEILAFVSGAALIGLGVLGGREPSEILVGAGCSLLASSVVSFFAAVLYARVGKAWEIVSSWGLRDIFKTRQRMNARCDETFGSMRNHLDIVAWGMNSFRSSDKAKVELPRKLLGGLKVRILAPHPDGAFTQQQDSDEGKKTGATRYSILELEKWVNALERDTRDNSGAGSIELRFYDFRPQDFYFRQDDFIYTGPYLYGMDSQQTISFEYERPSHGFTLYSTHFENVWANAANTPQAHRGMGVSHFHYHAEALLVE